MTLVMRGTLLVALVVCAAWPAGAGQLPPRDAARSAGDAAVLRGTVRAADTEMPLRHAEVLLSGNPLPNRGGLRWTLTDQDGRYEFAGLSAGSYTVVASKTGYVMTSYGQVRPARRGRPVQLTGSETRNDVNMALPRGGVIVVRITDRFGEPAVGYRVAGYQPGFVDGRRQLAETAGDLMQVQVTDDRGELRLSGLVAGEYYVGALRGLSSPARAAPRDSEPQTFYPGTMLEAEAQPIAVGTGEEVVAAFQLANARLARIRGVIARSGSLPNLLMVRTSLGSTATHPVTVSPDGTFSAANLPPGDYLIVANGDGESGTLRLQVSGEDLDGLLLTMKPPARLRGRLTVDAGTSPRPRLTNVALRPAFTEDSGLLNPPMKVADDGTFEMTDVSGTGVLRLYYGPGLFLNAVLLDGVDVTNTPLELRAYEGRRLEVQLTERPIEVAGTVTDEGRPARDRFVVVYAQDRVLWTPQTLRIAVARTDGEGRFTIRGVPPGRYLVAAVDHLEPGEERYPETLERLRRAATPVTLEEGQSTAIEIVLTR